MSYAGQEESVTGGEPIELYEFELAGEYTRLSSTEDDVDYGGNVWVGSSIKRSEVVVGPEDRADVLEIEAPSNLNIVRQFVNLPPGQDMNLTIKRVHRSDGSSEIVSLFVGVVASVGLTLNGRRAKIGVLPITAAVARSIPRAVYAGRCQNVLYSDRCSVSNTNHRVASTISAVDSNDSRVLTITGIVAAIGATAVGGGTAQVAGGYVTTDGLNFRMIRRAIDANTIELWLPFGESVAGLPVEVFAGCAHDADDCALVFDNIEGQSGSGGYFAFEFSPTDNPFTKGL